jgi:hypothetical protein
MKIVPVARISFVLISLAVFITGCTRQPRIEDLPQSDPQELIARAVRNDQALLDFSGAGLVEVSDANLHRTVAGLQVKLLKPDFLEVKLRGPFGIGLGSLTLAGDRYCLKVNSDHLQKSGWISQFEFPLEMNLPIGGREVRALFQPLITIQADSDSLVTLTDPKTQQFKLQWLDQGELHQVWADPYQPYFQRELTQSANGDTLWDKRVSGARLRSGVYLPDSWTIQIGQAQNSYRVNIAMSQLKINEGLNPDDFLMEADSSHDQDQ